MKARRIFAILIGLSVSFLSAATALAQAPTLVTSWPTSGIPTGLLLDGTGNIYVGAQYTGPGLVKYSTSGTPLMTVPGTAGREIYGLGRLANGDILEADYYGRSISEYTSTGDLVRTWLTGGIIAGYFAMDESENVYLTDGESDRIRKFSSTGAILGDWAAPHPTGIGYWQGVIYSVGYYDGTVTNYLPSGAQVGGFPDGLTHPDQTCFDANGQLYVADPGSGMLRCYTGGGAALWTLGPSIPGYGFGPARFISVAVDNDGTVYAGDYDHDRVLVFRNQPTPTVRTSFGAVKVRYR